MPATGIGQSAQRRVRAISNRQDALQAAIGAISDMESLLRAVDCVLALGAAQRIITEDDHADLSFIVSEYSERNCSGLEPFDLSEFAAGGVER